MLPLKKNVVSFFEAKKNLMSAVTFVVSHACVADAA